MTSTCRENLNAKKRALMLAAIGGGKEGERGEHGVFCFAVLLTRRVLLC